jgi:6-phosphogluconolactonase
MKALSLVWFALSLAFAVSSLSLWAAAPATATDRGQVRVYFGTYTGAKSKGIYVCGMDLATGRLGTPTLAGEVTNPSFVALHPTQPFLYAVSEVGNFDGKKTGSVAAFAVEAGTGKLTLLNQQPSGGDGPCHVNVDQTGSDVLVANYGGGSCSVYSVQRDGALSSATAFMQHQGSSANRQRQQAPHAHGIYLDARNRFVFVPDLGLDKIMVYKFDARQGSLTANDPPFAAVAPGSGPRHFAFHPSGKFAYVINEIRCTVTAFTYDPDRGVLAELQTVSTLPTGESVLPSFSTAELQVHPSGRFLYGSNRGHNTIAVFTIDAGTGRLTPTQHESTQGKTPRGFGIDPSGKFLLAANQDSDTVVPFKIDTATGRLLPTGQTVEMGSPVCVAFAPAPH